MPRRRVAPRPEPRPTPLTRSPPGSRRTRPDQRPGHQPARPASARALAMKRDPHQQCDDRRHRDRDEDAQAVHLDRVAATVVCDTPEAARRRMCRRPGQETPHRPKRLPTRTHRRSTRTPGGRPGSPVGPSCQRTAAPAERKLPRAVPRRPGIKKDPACTWQTGSKKNRRRPTLPGPCGPSTIGAEGLNGSVRNGKRCFPLAIATGNR